MHDAAQASSFRGDDEGQSVTLARPEEASRPERKSTPSVRFELVTELGRGGMGVVYEAIDRDNGERVALKRLHKLSGQALYQFKREFRALREVHHPNLIRLGELLEEDGAWFFTMELVEGISLLDYVRRTPDIERSIDTMPSSQLEYADTLTLPRLAPPSGPGPAFDELRLRAVLPQLIDAIAAVHNAGKIHRDIKPSNVMVTAAGRVVVLDFGLIVERDSTEQTTEVFIVGTPAYMAPEQARREPVGPATDWYAVGATLYEILTGSVTHDAEHPIQLLMQKQQQRPALPSAIAPGIPADLDQLCMQLLSIDPEQRPAYADIQHHLGIDATEILISPVRDVFVGRKAALGQLSAAFDRVREGHPVFMLVSGESGVGKSALVHHFTSQLDAEVIVLRGRCREHESVPFNALDGVIDALSKTLQRRWRDAGFVPRHAAVLRQAFPVLSRIKSIENAPLPARQPGDPIERRNRVFAGLRDLLGRVCDQFVVVVTIDDMQWADDDSLALMAALMRKPDTPTALLIATVSSEAADRVASKLPRTASVMELPPLAAHEARELALLASGGELDDRTLRHIIAETSGHPLFVHELARSTGEHAGLATLVLDDVIRQRVRALEVDARTIVELVCLSSAPLPPAIVCDAAELSAQAFAREHARLLEMRLLKPAGGQYAERLEPYHDRVRASVTDSIAHAVQRRYHAALAEAVLGTRFGRDHPEHVVHHLAGAGSVEQAAAHAEIGAGRAIAAFAYDRAANLYARALQLHGKKSTSYGLLMASATAHARAGRAHEAAKLFARSAKKAPAKEHLTCLRESAFHYLIAGNSVVGTKIAQKALKRAGLRLPTRDFTVLLYVLWLELLLLLFGKPKRPEPSKVATKQQWAEFDLLTDLGRSYTHINTLHGRQYLLSALYLSARMSEEAWMQAALMECTSMAARGGRRRLKKVREMRSQLAPRVQQSGNERLIQLDKLVVATHEYFSSRFTIAEKRCREAEREYLTASEQNWPELGLMRLLRAMSLKYIGGVKKLQRLIDQYIAEANQRGDVFWPSTLAFRIPLPWIASGTIAQWHTYTATLHTDQHKEHTPTLLGFYRIAGKAEVALAQRAQAHETSALIEQLVRYTNSLVARGASTLMFDSLILSAQLRLLHWTSGTRKEILRVARRLLRGDARYAHAPAHLLIAGCHYRSGDTPAAVESLQAAAVKGNECGMLLLMHVVSLRLAALEPGRHLDSERAARDWMAEQDISDVDAVMSSIAPGFD